ncbi:MAG: hypothetical protein JST80_10005 [Bdellovibrionales bacterium]|nr:hypothetical protein [Bdellovibrionales bacterium]
MKFEQLFEDKVRLLRKFLEVTQDYKQRFSQDVEVEKKMDWVDELSDLREAHMKTLKLLDVTIEQEKKQLNRTSIEKLQGNENFKKNLGILVDLIKEIQLTDQSLFLYIQNMGFELRAQILKGLKEKEAVSKFKSAQSGTGEGLDKTV